MASSSQAEKYFPISIARSDGYNYQNVDHAALTPTDPRDKDVQFRWEVLLGHYLKEQLAPRNQQGNNFKLTTLPDGYHLRAAQGAAGKKTYYMYGHPAGAKSYYRNPAAFAPHLLWLASDSVDYAQCSCAFCPKLAAANGDWARARQALATQSPAPGSRTPALTPTFASSAATTTTAAAAATPSPAPPPTMALAGSSAAAGPPATSLETIGFYSIEHVFRSGELVWYKQNAHWRLGRIQTILRKPEPFVAYSYDNPNVDSNFTYVMAPLGHASLNQQTILKEAIEMRPFLTYSVPATSMPGLEGKKYADIDWPRLAEARAAEVSEPAVKAMRKQQVGLEASKVAARELNNSYSTFNFQETNTTADGSHTRTSYAGIFLGAEMMVSGDPVRVSLPSHETEAFAHARAAGAFSAISDAAVMRVDRIGVFTDALGAASLQLTGDVYRQVRGRAPLPEPAVADVATMLGPPFAVETQFRNNVEGLDGGGGGGAGEEWGWALMEPGAQRGETEVKGRFYVTSMLMAIAGPAQLQEAYKKRQVPEAQGLLNERCNWGGCPYVGRMRSRAEAFGYASSVEYVPPTRLREDQ